uniref:Uncharacterized protein n=1 Tax=Chenopodium quinoa TaxID=63459 RepID=A0A803M7K2_CHEQI
MAKLIDSHGKIILVQPSTAAEIMLKHPGFAVSSIEELRQTRQLRSLKADDVLLARKVYILVPVDKVNSILSKAQLNFINEIVIRSFCDHILGGGRTRGGSRVFPCSGGSGVASQRIVVVEPRRRCNAWKPVLEPILEEC